MTLLEAGKEILWGWKFSRAPLLMNLWCFFIFVFKGWGEEDRLHLYSLNLHVNTLIWLMLVILDLHVNTLIWLKIDYFGSPLEDMYCFSSYCNECCHSECKALYHLPEF